MTIKIGERIPSTIFKQLTENGLEDMSSDSVFGGKKIVMFGLPGAFTPDCSAKHMPSYTKAQKEFTSLGIDLACLSVNDPFVMQAWSANMKADGIVMLADGNATFTKALGLEFDGSGYGLGIRAQRFALYAENSMVKFLAVEKPGTFDVSSAGAVLSAIRALNIAA